jgi:putative ABC transport system substrate-binding protein
MKRYLAVAVVLVGIAFLAYLFWQPAQSRPRVIALVQLTEVDASTVAGFKAGMAAAGYREGHDVIYLSKGPAVTVDRLEGIIREHLAQKPDLFMVSSTPATQQVKRLTEGLAIPVVFAPVNDPLGAGIVADLRHPGGHITGVRLPAGDDVRLKWLTEIAPSARRVLVPYTPGDKSARTSLDTALAVAPALGVTILEQPVPGDADIAALLAARSDRVDALFLPRDSSVEARIKAIVAYADGRRLPVCAPSLRQVAQGALMSYGFVHEEIGQQAARLADQIFKGVSPGDLPVEMAESILSLNTATARRIGLTIPEDALRQAEKIVRE